MLKKILLGSIAISLFGGGLRCQSKSSSSRDSSLEYVASYKFDEESLSKHLSAISSTPHPMGSTQQETVRDYIIEQGKALGLSMYTDTFQASVPNPVLLDSPDAPAALSLEKTGHNVYGLLGGTKSCVYLVGSHYDSKYFADIEYRGANDSGSSSAALFPLVEAIKEYPTLGRCDYLFVWFDGEEAYLPEWNDGIYRHPAKTQDNTYGSRHLADSLIECQNSTSWCLPENYNSLEVKGLLLLDMIGSPEISLSRDRNSDPDWLSLALVIDSELKLNLFGSSSLAIEDDHIPFKNKGITVLNLIDFHHLDYWHKAGDDQANVSISSITAASKIALGTLLKINE